VQAADAIERAVGAVRDNTTGRAITVARAVVYGTFAAIVGSAALVLVVILSVRMLDAYLPSSVFGETHTWAAHLVAGVIFTAVGLIFWSLRKRSATEEYPTGV
jgi:hypothetical protein